MLGIFGFLARLIQESTNGEGEPQQHVGICQGLLTCKTPH